MRQLSFNVSIVNDNIPEDAEMFNVSLTLDPADQARLGKHKHVTVSPEVATITIQDDEGNMCMVTCIKWNNVLPIVIQRNDELSES